MAQVQTLYSTNGSVAGTGALQVAHATYNFAVDGGGAPGLITPAANATIPINAIIIGGTINSTTAGAGASATVSVGTSAGSSATSLLAATAIGSFSTNAKLNSAATLAAPVKMSAAGSITITSAVAALTAGVFEIFVYYVVSPS
jgi:hypothetical protein